MIIIDTTSLLDVQVLQEEYPDFVAVTDCDRTKLGLDMEVLLRSNGEDFRAKVEEIDGEVVVAKVLRNDFDFPQPFGFLDWIRFEKKNIINIYVIDGVLY